MAFIARALCSGVVSIFARTQKQITPTNKERRQKMSGGSFDYLYNKFENENPLDTNTLELLEKMSEWLAEPEQNQKSAADELKRVHSELAEIKERIFKLAQNRPFLDLLKEAEYWCSSDTGKNDFESEWAKYEVQQNKH
jgi:hypothetical protein